jgi:hypothetical protein
VPQHVVNAVLEGTAMRKVYEVRYRFDGSLDWSYEYYPLREEAMQALDKLAKEEQERIVAFDKTAVFHVEMREFALTLKNWGVHRKTVTEHSTF